MNTTGKNNSRFEGIKINNRYEILKKIAAGGMADVYLGLDLSLGKKVAIKILHESYSINGNFISRFKREAQILANLKSENIVEVYSWGEFKGFYYIVMEYVSGLSLKELIEKRGALNAETAAKYCLQICNALELAHANNLIHRDIKPQNIMITDDGFIKVTDFGIAKSTADELTKTINVFGTAHYVSPEQVQGKVLDLRADIYSLGVVMYEMLTADVPFRGGSPIDISLRHLNENPQPPSKIIHGIATSFEKIVMKCLEKNPTYRYQSIGQLKTDMKNYLEGRPVAPDSPLKSGAEKTDLLNRLKNYFERDSQLEKVFLKYDRINKRNRTILVFFNSLLFISTVIFILLFILSYSRINSMMEQGFSVEVPLLVNTEIDSAKSLILHFGLRIEVDSNKYDDSVPENHIISQKPSAGSIVKKDTTVYVTVSSGKKIPLVLVPDLSGMKINDALQEIKNAGLSDVTINEEYSETVKTDIVISQNPESGTPVEKNTAVNLSVSMGPQFITVPDIIGYDYSTARSNLESIGLITVFKLKTDLSVQPGTVISIEPAEGTHVYKNSTVVVFISTSQQLATVPDLTGMDFEKAVGVLEGMQIEYEVSPVKVDYSIQRNSVIAQFPEAGDQILQNERIILFVGQ